MMFKKRVAVGVCANDRFSGDVAAGRLPYVSLRGRKQDVF
jgi:hypothetical protein